MKREEVRIVLVHSNLAPTLELYITSEILRQAQVSFNVALCTSIASAVLGFIGAGLLLSGQLSEGSVAAAVGISSSLCCSKMAKDANDRLEHLLSRKV